MASELHSPADGPASQPPAASPRVTCGPAMTRCECAGLTFEEVARRIAAEGIGFELVLRRTGCGQTCGACVPDLRHYLATR